MKMDHIHVIRIWKQQSENLELDSKAGGQYKINTQIASPILVETF